MWANWWSVFTGLRLSLESGSVDRERIHLIALPRDMFPVTSFLYLRMVH